MHCSLSTTHKKTVAKLLFDYDVKGTSQNRDTHIAKVFRRVFCCSIMYVDAYQLYTSLILTARPPRVNKMMMFAKKFLPCISVSLFSAVLCGSYLHFIVLYDCWVIQPYDCLNVINRYYLRRSSAEVMFLVRSVCLSVCPSDYSQTCERILTKFFGGVGHGSRTK